MVHSKEGLRKAKWNPKKRHFARCIQNKNMHWKTQNASKGTQRHHLGFRVWKGVRASQPEGPERNLVKISSHTREITLTANFRSEAQSLFSVFFFLLRKCSQLMKDGVFTVLFLDTTLGEHAHPPCFQRSKNAHRPALGSSTHPPCTWGNERLSAGVLPVWCSDGLQESAALPSVSLLSESPQNH